MGRNHSSRTWILVSQSAIWGAEKNTLRYSLLGCCKRRDRNSNPNFWDISFERFLSCYTNYSVGDSAKNYLIVWVELTHVTHQTNSFRPQNLSMSSAMLLRKLSNSERYKFGSNASKRSSTSCTPIDSRQ